MSSGAQQQVTPEASPQDVAALLRARTKDPAGQELGEWTDETRPNFEQVQEQIDIARALTRIDLGEIPDECREGAETTVALLAAMLVESGYFPEQVAQGQSAYDRLLALYEQARTGVGACVQAHGTAGATSGVYELDLTGGACAWPVDWWQRNLERLAGG